jgi:hypothetical protein
MAAPSMQQLAVYFLDSINNGAEERVAYKNIAAYLLVANKSYEIEKFERAVMGELDRRGITVIRLSSPLPVGANIKQRIASYFHAENPLFVERSDDSMLGGLIAQTADKTLDLSASSKISVFKRVVSVQND